MKRGQVSLFIISVLLIIAILGIFFFIKFNLNNDSISDIGADSLINFVQNCIKETSTDAVYNLGKTGGYFSLPDNSLDINIVYYNKENPLISKEDLEKELSKFIDKSLFFCTKNFVDFVDFEIKQEKIESSSQIKEEIVEFEIKYPLTINKGSQVIKIKDFESSVDVNLYEIYKVVENLTSYYMENDGRIPINSMHETAIDNNFIFDMYDYDDNTLVVNIIDLDSELNERPYEFSFGLRN